MEKGIPNCARIIEIAERKELRSGRRMPEASIKRTKGVVLCIVLVFLVAGMIVLALHYFNLWLAGRIGGEWSGFTIGGFSLMEGLILILFGVGVLVGETQRVTYHGMRDYHWSIQEATRGGSLGRHTLGFAVITLAFALITAGILMFLIYFFLL